MFWFTNRRTYIDVFLFSWQWRWIIRYLEIVWVDGESANQTVEFRTLYSHGPAVCLTSHSCSVNMQRVISWRNLSRTQKNPIFKKVFSDREINQKPWHVGALNGKTGFWWTVYNRNLPSYFLFQKYLNIHWSHLLGQRSLKICQRHWIDILIVLNFLFMGESIRKSLQIFLDLYSIPVSVLKTIYNFLLFSNQNSCLLQWDASFPLLSIS